MIPEEKFNKGVWYVLKKIKERSSYTKQGEPIEYQVKFYGYHEPAAPSPENEVEILEKLQEWGAIRIRNKEDIEISEYISPEAQIFYLEILQPEFDKLCKKWEEIDENPWLPEESKIIQRKKLFKRQQKQSKENTINFPTDPDVIEEYLNILNRIEKERQRTPKGEPIAFPVPKRVLFAKGVPLPEQETSILRIFEQDGIIQITEKTIPIIDEFDPYENSEIIRAVKIPDLDKFKNYRDKLSDLKNQLGKSYKERKADAEARAKKLRKQFEELNERQKELKELEERIYSRVRKDFEVPIQYYEEITKKISEQLAPIKDALEQAGKLQSAHIKNYLTPALQRLAPYLRQAEEEMKKINEIYSSSKTPYLSKAIVSSNLIEIEQRNQIISEISDLRKLVKELQTKEDVEREQKPLLIKIVGGMEGVEKNLEAIATKNEDVTVTKGKKRIRLPHFPPTAWKDVSIRFLDERNVFIQGNKKTSIADCESLGFLDEKSSKPNLGWEWLLELVRNNGESKEYPSPIPDTIKQRKRQISDFLQRLFKNDTNSFETIETGLRKVKYRAKITLIPPQADANNEESDHLGIKEYLKETMTSQYEPPKNENDY